MTKVSARPEKIPSVRLIPTPMDLLKVRATAYATADPSTIPERETTSLVARSPHQGEQVEDEEREETEDDNPPHPLHDLGLRNTARNTANGLSPTAVIKGGCYRACAAVGRGAWSGSSAEL